MTKVEAAKASAAKRAPKGAAAKSGDEAASKTKAAPKGAAATTGSRSPGARSTASAPAKSKAARPAGSDGGKDVSANGATAGAGGAQATKPAAAPRSGTAKAGAPAKPQSGATRTEDAKTAATAKAGAAAKPDGTGTSDAVRARTPAAKATKPAVGPFAGDSKFLEEQRRLLQEDRAVYLEQATALKAEADSLAQEREPGDVQFDEESGEGGTVTVDRERDLALSAQALGAVDEIEAALLRIDDRTYGTCERCQQPIPKPRLRALPYARLCVACKSGGLSRR